MANRRMFSLSVVDTDKFLSMPASARLLYYELGMRADDDGFLLNARKNARAIGAKAGDLQRLVDEGFLIAFDTGVYAVRHWLTNNQIRRDRYRETVCRQEKSRLMDDGSGAYVLAEDGEARLPDGCRKGNPDKVRSGKDRIYMPQEGGEEKRTRSFPPTVEEVAAYCRERQNGIDPAEFIDHYAASGWMRGRTQIRDWKACVRSWERYGEGGMNHGRADEYERI